MNSKMIPVVSSNIAGYKHLPLETLIIAFTSGKVYGYENVPVSVVEAFEAATSKGSFFNQAIKNDFKCQQLTEEDVAALVMDDTFVPSTPSASAALAKKMTLESLTDLMNRYSFLQLSF